MSEVLKVVKHDKEGALVRELELILPTAFAELGTIPGEEKSLMMVRNQMKIEARARGAGEGRKPSILGKAKKAVTEALKDGDISVDDLIAFIKAKKGIVE